MSEAAVKKDILSILEFSNAELDHFFSLPPIEYKEKNGKVICIPAAYVRSRGEDRLKRTWMNNSDATHDLMVNDMMPTHMSEMLYPVHDVPTPSSKKVNFLLTSPGGITQPMRLLQRTA